MKAILILSLAAFAVVHSQQLSPSTTVIERQPIRVQLETHQQQQEQPNRNIHITVVGQRGQQGQGGTSNTWSYNQNSGYNGNNGGYVNNGNNGYNGNNGGYVNNGNNGGYNNGNNGFVGNNGGYNNGNNGFVGNNGGYNNGNNGFVGNNGGYNNGGNNGNNGDNSGDNNGDDNADNHNGGEGNQGTCIGLHGRCNLIAGLNPLGRRQCCKGLYCEPAAFEGILWVTFACSNVKEKLGFGKGQPYNTPRDNNILG